MPRKKSYVMHGKDEYIKWRTSVENGGEKPCGTLLVWRRKGVKNVVVPDGVEVIGKGCFQSSIGDVMLPSSVTEIQDFAFDICNGMVYIPDSVTKISEYAFGDLEWRKNALQKMIADGVLKNPNPPIVQSVIKTTENSMAHLYAQEHGIPYEFVSFLNS